MDFNRLEFEEVNYVLKSGKRNVFSKESMDFEF